MSKQHSFTRRGFIQGLGLGVVGSMLVGCGSDGGQAMFPPGNSTPGPGGPAPAPTTGPVNSSELGGLPLRVLSSMQSSDVGADGTVTVASSASGAQVLFALDGSDQLRGMSLKIPGQTLAMGASSTALALVFMVPGIVTVDPVLAADRATRLQAAPSFAALVALLTNLLPTSPLPTVLPQLQTLITAVIEEATGTGALLKVFNAEEAITARPGGLFVTAGVDLSPANGSFDINNESFRYVSVVRQFFTTRGTSAQSQRTNLIGAPITNAVSVVGAANGFSLGNFLTGQVFSPSTARDNFSLLEHDPALEHVVYYMRGLGFAGHVDNVDLPEDVSATLFEDKADGATLLLSFLFPIVEILVGTSVAAGRSYQELADLVGDAAAANAALGTVTAANTGDPKGLASALINAFQALMGTPAFADGLAVTIGEGVLATALEAVLLYGGLVLGVANFLATATDIVTRPRISAISVPVPVTPFSEVLGAAPDFNALLDVSAQGIVVYQNIEGTAFRKKPFAAAQSLGGPTPFADLSEEGGFTTYADADGNVFLRSDAGVTGTVPRPAGLTPSLFSTNPKIDAKGTAVAAQATLGETGVAEIFLFERAVADSISLGTNTVRPQGLALGGLNANFVFARGGIGRSSTELARYDRVTRTWRTRQLSSAPLTNLQVNMRGVNRIDEVLLSEYKEDDDGFNPVSSVETILVETNTGIERVFEAGLQANGPGVRPDPVGINDEGEILAVLYTYPLDRQNITEETVLFKRRGGTSQTSLATLLPRGMPAGNYRGLGLGGKYIVARNLTTEMNYLVFLGRTFQDVQALLRFGV